jgi:DNA-binding NtrC family response regulator
VHRLRFTLVEDDPDSLFLLHWKLNEAFPGSSFASFSTAEDALRHVVHEGTDLLITNHAIGPMDGADLIRQLRQMGSAIPIIMISGNPELEKEARQAGATEFVIKQADTTRLEHEIRKLVGD